MDYSLWQKFIASNYHISYNMGARLGPTPFLVDPLSRESFNQVQHENAKHEERSDFMMKVWSNDFNTMELS